MERILQVGPDVISDESDCYVIAEVGHNHQGNLQTARELARQAKECGASAIKLQKRDNRSLYTRATFDKPYDNENSFGPTYGLHREALEFGIDEYRELQRYCHEIGITFLATAFDFASADFLAALDIAAFKIASGDLRNLPLLQHVARFGKPMFVSTGGGTLEDVQRAYDALMPINPRLCLMQCTMGYPADWGELDLEVIRTYRRRFPGTVVGYSGHDNGIAMAVVAYVLGARVVEKHFTLNRAMKGTDHKFSLEPVGMRKMVRDLRRVRIALGDGVKKFWPSEREAVYKMGKKLVASRDLRAGHALTLGDIAIKSPGDGLPPCELERVLGKVTLRDLAADENIALEVLADPAEAQVEESVRANRGWMAT
ncbi:MAG: N-acetylneuraminate synthase family protein [Nitrospinota bacterium]